MIISQQNLYRREKRSVPEQTFESPEPEKEIYDLHDRKNDPSIDKVLQNFADYHVAPLEPTSCSDEYNTKANSGCNVRPCNQGVPETSDKLNGSVR